MLGKTSFIWLDDFLEKFSDDDYDNMDDAFIY